MTKNLFLYFISTLLCSFAWASDGSSGNMFYEMVFGNPNQRKAVRDHQTSNNVSTESCNDYGGFLGIINGFFCHMEKDIGISGVGAVTKTFSDGAHNMTIRAEIAATAVTVNSISYTHQAKVWICVNSCSSAANFTRAFYVAFSYSPTSGINKGYAEHSPGSFDGTSGQAVQIEYDIGSSTVTQFVNIKGAMKSGSTTFKMRARAQKTSTSFAMNMSMHDGTNGNRMSMSTTPGTDSKYIKMYFEATGGPGTNGFGSVDSAGLSTPSHSSCFSGAETGESMNFSASSSANCSSYNFVAFDYYANTASGSPSVQSLSASDNSILSAWSTNMSATPSSI